MRQGFNLIEVVIALALIAIVAAVTLPRASGFIDSIQVRGAVTEIAALFSTARHAAIVRGARATLEIDTGSGIILVRVEGDTLAIREVSAAHGVGIITNRASITYSPIGVAYGAANFTMTVRRNDVADTIYVSRLGRVRN